jgi:hypothetical protein
MTSKNRVFSHLNDINYNDYIRNKQGVEIIKNTKSKIGPKIIKYFYSYSDFITLAKVYYKYLTRGQVGIQVPTNILNTNTSFLVYDKVNAHVNSCKYCYNNSKLNCGDLLNCSDLLGILYPYGKYISNNINKNMYFPSRIDLNNWCSNSCSNNNSNYDSNIDTNNDKPEKNITCDCSLTNKRYLFI